MKMLSTLAVCFGILFSSKTFANTTENCHIINNDIVQKYCDIEYEASDVSLYASMPIRGSVTNIKWVGDEIVLVQALNTLTGYKVKNDKASQYFQFDLNKDAGQIHSADMAISEDGRFLLVTHKNKISLINLKNGNLLWNKVYYFKKPEMTISASEMFNNNLILALSDNKTTDIYISNFNTNKLSSNPKAAKLNDLIGKNPYGKPINSVIGTIFPLKADYLAEAGAGFEGYLQDKTCENKYFMSSATLLPENRKTLQKSNNATPCRKFVYPRGEGYTIAILAKKKFFINAEGYENETVKSATPIQVTYFKEGCEGLAIDYYRSSNEGLKKTKTECLKNNKFNSATALSFSNTGKYLAFGGLNTEFEIIRYPENQDVKID